MAFLKFNKAELVNLSYSLKREIICASKTGAYCNTGITTCNTRRYHGLLSVTLDRFGGDKFLLLSSLDETLEVGGKLFNLGIHRYDTVVEPKGHKYIVDFTADPVPQITYKVGAIVFRKTLLINPSRDQFMVRYELLEAPSPVKLSLMPFLAFRNIHDLTFENPQACLDGVPADGGVSFCMYHNFPRLYLQMNTREVNFRSAPCWYKGISYTDEYRRGYPCREDLFVPGSFSVVLKPGGKTIFSASLREENIPNITRTFNRVLASTPEVTNSHDQLVRCADSLVCNHNDRKKINAGFSWKYTGLLRETLFALPGLTLYATGSSSDFEEILDNLIADEQDRFYRRTTQVEAPLYLASVLQQYIDFGADPAYVWKKYGPVVRGIIESYGCNRRAEVSLQPNGLLWTQMEGVALSWMNAYVDGHPVTERAGFQVETNALWYNTVCFALEMEALYGEEASDFIRTWVEIRDLARRYFQQVFWNPELGYLADYVDASGKNMQVRPNQLFALWVKYSPVDDEIAHSILRVVDNELLTDRGIRTLSPRDPDYKGVYEGSQSERDLAFHQGSTRPFLLQHFVDVSLRIKGPAFRKRAEWLVEGFYEDLAKHGVGAFSELYDGDPPHEPHGAISSALSTAGLLAVDYLLSRYKE